MKPLVLLAIAFVCIPAPGRALSPEASARAQSKLDRIMEDELGPGESITLTEDELNSFLRYGYAEELPQGVRDLTVRFEPEIGTVTGFADFAKLSEEGDSPGRLLLMMFSGERAFEARVRYVTARGLARVEIESFQIDGREMSGPLLNWVVNTLVAPRMEGFELGRPTPLAHNLEEVRLESKRAVVTAADTFATR